MNDEALFAYHTVEPDPHALRRRRMLAAHPTLRQLIGPSPATAAWIVGLTVVQLGLSIAMCQAPWWLWLGSAATAGIVVSHGLWVLIHDCAHGLVWRSRAGNHGLAVLANLAHGFPAAASFRIFHLQHHAHQGEYGRDTDLPSGWEVRLFGNSRLGKAAWLGLYPVLLILRSARVARLGGIRAVQPAVVLNVVAGPAFDTLWVWGFGWPALVWLLVSFYLATGPSPLGARWIQEHFVLFGAQETNSYVGPCNRVAFNVGLHNEHNDFTGVPWHRLPELRRRAGEFYVDQPVLRSYLALYWRFVMDPTLSIGSRMVRPSLRSEDLRLNTNYSIKESQRPIEQKTQEQGGP